MNKLFDLRFVIGSFFSVVGLLLLIYSILTAAGANSNINRLCSIVFLLFGAVMILLSLQKDAHDELLEEEHSRGVKKKAR